MVGLRRIRLAIANALDHVVLLDDGLPEIMHLVDSRVALAGRGARQLAYEIQDLVSFAAADPVGAREELDDNVVDVVVRHDGWRC